MVPRMGVRTEYRIYWLTQGSGSEVVVILLTGVPAELGRGLGNLERIRMRSSGQGLSHLPVVIYSSQNPSVDLFALRGAVKWGQKNTCE